MKFDFDFKSFTSPRAQAIYTWLYWIFIACMAVLLISSARAEVSVPQRPTQHYSLDLTNTLTQGDLAKIDDLAKGLETSKKVSFAVLMIPSLEGQDIAQYALAVGEKWRPGIDGVGKGAILIIAKNDKKFRVEVTRNLEGELPDASIKQALDSSKHFFKEGNFGGGILSIIQKLGAKIDSPVPVSTLAATNEEESSSLMTFVMSILGVFGVFGSVLAWYSMRQKAEDEARRKYLAAKQKEYEDAERERIAKIRADAEARAKANDLNLTKNMTFTPAYKEPLDIPIAQLSGATIKKTFTPPPYVPPVRKPEPPRKPEHVRRRTDDIYVAPVVIDTSPSYSRSSRDDNGSHTSGSFSSSSSSDFGGGGSGGSWD